MMLSCSIMHRYSDGADQGSQSGDDGVGLVLNLKSVDSALEHDLNIGREFHELVVARIHNTGHVQENGTDSKQGGLIRDGTGGLFDRQGKVD